MPDNKNPTDLYLLLEYLKHAGIPYYKLKTDAGETCLTVDMEDGYHIVRTFNPIGKLVRTYISKIVSNRFDLDKGNKNE